MSQKFKDSIKYLYPVLQGVLSGLFVALVFWMLIDIGESLANRKAILILATDHQQLYKYKIGDKYIYFKVDESETITPYNMELPK